ncbi:GNAT family N-acetyltransferase [Alkalicoccobacillus porphyridii]|uniref:GNAT family N-acetyltransferase n=1 Tax=Alkalicoccobacillus porphyridii TaxID=2597270 RepID=A0A554A251_9BACI|nr:GNAT family N-acetyltransferase [Alkalicoccobacillus porphyridii]TSB47767.1 GNAT family N-acetyltransferase [Alkalicoccobacillus porphyridii]
MPLEIVLNLSLSPHEVPDLRERVGWGRRDEDYPALFERCNFWAGVKDHHNHLIAFGYVCGMGLEHGYMEDIIVHPEYQGRGIGAQLVKGLLEEAERFGIEIMTVSYAEDKASFYEKCGFTTGAGGVWRVVN